MRSIDISASILLLTMAWLSALMVLEQLLKDWPMNGMDRATGAPLSGDDHLAQSIADILTTPIGTRVMRRDYGSAIPELLDQPMNPVTKLRLFAAAAVAIARWEPRIAATRFAVTTDPASGSFAVRIEGQRAGSAGPVSLTSLTIPLPKLQAA